MNYKFVRYVIVNIPFNIADNMGKHYVMNEINTKGYLSNNTEEICAKNGSENGLF